MYRVFTIGHSNQSIESFIDQLAKFKIEAIADVRSSPYSKYTPHFSKDNLKLSLQTAGLKYVFLGRELGGMPKDESFYDEDGHVLYWKIAESEAFKTAIERLSKGSTTFTIALLCGEEDPSGCHRRLLVAKVLQDNGIDVGHIRGNGSVHSESDLQAQEQPSEQLTIFSVDKDTPWKSKHKVR
ncbi:MAG: DUF488 domain-containing protein [Candidatus Obscuribacterales bacterium]|nr:DUF488 domain-containing protein [Candidatus Obscuribacterales bacterium]